MGDRIQSNIIDTKSPDKVVNVDDMLLVGLGGKDSLE